MSRPFSESDLFGLSVRRVSHDGAHVFQPEGVHLAKVGKVEAALGQPIEAEVATLARSQVLALTLPTSANLKFQF